MLPSSLCVVLGKRINMIEAKASVEINCSPEEVWNYLIRIDDWWLRSNPKEHIELTLVGTKEINEGTQFILKEYIAGIKGEALAEISEIVPLKKLVWRSIKAQYKLLGFKTNIEEGGIFTLTESASGCTLSHYVWGKIRNSHWSPIIEWLFKNVLKGEKKDYEHTYRELIFVKKEMVLSHFKWVNCHPESKLLSP